MERRAATSVKCSYVMYMIIYLHVANDLKQYITGMHNKNYDNVNL